MGKLFEYLNDFVAELISFTRGKGRCDAKINCEGVQTCNALTVKIMRAMS